MDQLAIAVSFAAAIFVGVERLLRARGTHAANLVEAATEIVEMYKTQVGDLTHRVQYLESVIHKLQSCNHPDCPMKNYIEAQKL